MFPLLGEDKKMIQETAIEQIEKKVGLRPGSGETDCHCVRLFPPPPAPGEPKPRTKAIANIIIP